MSALNVRPNIKTGLRLLPSIAGGMRGIWESGNRKAVWLTILALCSTMLGTLFYFSEVKARQIDLSLSWNITADENVLKNSEYNIVPHIKKGKLNQYLFGYSFVIKKGCFQEEKEFPFRFAGDNGFRINESITCNSISGSVQIPQKIRVIFHDSKQTKNLQPENIGCAAEIRIGQPNKNRNSWNLLGTKSVDLQTTGFQIDGYAPTHMEVKTDDIGYFLLVYLRESQPADYNDKSSKPTGSPEAQTESLSTSSQAEATPKPDEKPAAPSTQKARGGKPVSDPTIAAPRPAKPKPVPKAKPPANYKEVKGEINFWWANHNIRPQDKYQRFRIWLGHKNSEGLWEYQTRELPISNAEAWHSIPKATINRDGTRLVVSGCKRWDKKRSACAQEEIIPISMSRKTNLEPVDSIVIQKQKPPNEILLDHQYVPPGTQAQPAPQTSANAGTKGTGALQGNLKVQVKFADGSKIDKTHPVWVFIKVYDRKRKLLNVLRQPAGGNGVAVFNYADFSKGADRARVISFCPLENSAPVAGESTSNDGRDITTPKPIHYIPDTKLLKGLYSAENAPGHISLQLKRMPRRTEDSTGLGEWHEGWVEFWTGISSKSQTNISILNGDYNIWIPVTTYKNNPKENIAVMLLLYDQHNTLVNCDISTTKVYNDASYARFLADTFSKEVSGAQVFAWSRDTPESFIPVSQRLDTREADIYSEADVKLGSITIEMFNLRQGTDTAAASAGRGGSISRRPGPKYHHPTRGVANIFMQDQNHKSLSGVGVWLSSGGKYTAYAKSDKDGLASFPLLDGSSFKLAASLKDYDLARGNPRLDRLPKRLSIFTFKAKKKEFFVSVMLLDAKTGKRLGRTSGQVKASALVDGKRVDTGEYDQNGYVNFKKLQIFQSKSNKDMLFKIDHPDYEPGEVRFKAGGGKSGDNMLSLKVSLRPNTKGLMVLINNAKNWQGYSEARQQLRTALIKYIRPIKNSKPGKAAADYQTLVYSALNGNTHVMQKPQLADLSDESLKKLIRGVLGTAATAPYATIKGLARFVDDFKEAFDSAGKWNVIMILAFDPLLSLDSGRVSQKDQDMIDELIRNLNGQGITLNVVDISDEAAEPRKLLEKACLNTKGAYLVMDRKGVSKLAGELADLFRGRSR